MSFNKWSTNLYPTVQMAPN